MTILFTISIAKQVRVGWVLSRMNVDDAKIVTYCICKPGKIHHGFKMKTELKRIEHEARYKLRLL